MKNNRLNDIPESGSIETETAFCEKVQESIEEEGRYYQKLNDELKKNPEFELTPEKIYDMEKRVASPYNIIRGYKQSYRKLNKATVMIAALLMILIISVMSVSSLRDYTINFLLSLDQTHGDVHVMDGVVVKSNSYAPTMIPEGYRISAFQTLDDTTMLVYSDDEANMLIFTQKPSDSSETIDTENAEGKDVTVNGYEGHLSIVEDGEAYLVWKTEDHLFTISISDNTIDLIPIAESVSKNK